MFRWQHIPSCADCSKYHYDTKKWIKSTRGGKPIERLPNEHPPCHQCPKGPEPFKKELTRRNEQALWYYQQCKVDHQGLLPRDAIVVRNNAMIRAVEERVNRSLLSVMSNHLEAIAIHQQSE